MTPPVAAAVPAPAIRPRRPARSGGQGRPARGTAPPRRISGPARSPSRPTGKGSAAGPLARRAHTRGSIALPAPIGLPGGSLVAGVLGALAGVSRSRMLDRLIRGRAWIGVVTFALIGIVAMQLWVVKLGVGIGRALEHAELLQRENSTLAIEDSSLSSGERIERLAQAQGMVLVPPGALHFDTPRGSLDTRLAAAALAKPVQPGAGGLGGSETGTGVGTGSVTGSTTGSEAPVASTAAGGEATGTSEGGAQSPSPEGQVAGSSGASRSAASATTESSATGAEGSAATASPASTAAATASTATGGSPEGGSPPAGPAGGTQAAPGG